MATMLDGVTVSDAQAKKIVKIAIEQNAYDSDMPGTKKERIEAAHEIIAFCIDAWKTDGARPDDDDPEIAEGAEAILKIFKVVGIEADDDGTITMPEDESDDDEDDEEYEDDDEEDEDEDEDDEEGPFEPDDYIEGYSELTVKTKIAKLKELDPEDDDDAAVLEAIKDWEEQQDKPASRVLNLIEELLGDEDDEDEEYEDDEDEELEDEEDDDEDEEEELEEEEEDEEDEEDDDDEEEEDDEELGEPWDGYDKLKVTEIKAQLNEMFDDDELTVDQLEYVKEYEEAQDQPSKRTLKLCDELIAKLGDSDEDDADDDEDDDPPAPKGKKLYISVGGKVVATLPAKGGELTIAVK